MAILKYKNGSKWEELDIGGGIQPLDEYPLYSTYASPYLIASTRSSGNIPCLPTSLMSPAQLFGGSWSEMTVVNDRLACHDVGQLGRARFYGGEYRVSDVKICDGCRAGALNYYPDELNISYPSYMNDPILIYRLWQRIA